MKKSSKDSVVTAAILLFNSKGYSGTSIRDIADAAKVNTATIAYYFGNKEGLLEYCFTYFFEQYINKMEASFATIEKGAAICLKRVVADLLHYQWENIQLASFVYREMSIDSQMVREIMATYSLKEKYYLQKIFERGFEWNEFRPHSIPYLIIQLKGLLMMPFMNTHYMREVLYVFPNEKFFEQKYLKDLYQWIDKTLCSDIQIKKEAIIK
ncbi:MULTISPECIES: forespore capture DNA-binding protein RefZ [Neobacillus]|uniref:Forespore capture DNA-binding protein RefZ n=1 Tax=Neobacillus rhizophilus TaxID=2833579 RepID=A0A942UAF5_9BACI|nr:MULTISPECIES: forespore capture DNA-binding protein RefZ [Neobacillus]MBS4215351.1 forespore capture DNA-binding protein RefZ [Neobacillus rhizophilus]MBU8919574.1 forespore capture DNA-binding protein RefZ [Bacillus sp. FJAT-29953]